MPEFNVEVKEVLSKVIVVEADSEAEAMEIAMHAYNDAEDAWVLTADNWLETEFVVRK